MTKYSIQIDNVEELSKAAKMLMESLGEKTLVALHGQMGAGKTTFIKSICRIMGVTDIVNSPTFSIVNLK